MGRRSNNQRRIYLSKHGYIPVDEFGRKFDIHHIDGDHSNNDIENLMAISLEDHYNIHLASEDWGACRLIAMRLNKSPAEISDLNRRAALKRFEDGTHHFIEMNKRDREDMRGDKNPMRDPVVVARLKDTVIGVRKSDDHVKSMKLGAKRRSAAKISCVFCRKECNDLNFTKWHGDRCPSNPSCASGDRITNFTDNNPSSTAVSCVYCRKKVNTPNFKRWHGDNCKGKTNVC